ncbi:MAG: hypothetical protein ACOCR6_01875 [archaeon]
MGVTSKRTEFTLAVTLGGQWRQPGVGRAVPLEKVSPGLFGRANRITGERTGGEAYTLLATGRGANLKVAATGNANPIAVLAIDAHGRHTPASRAAHAWAGS